MSLRHILTLHAKRYPKMEVADFVKLLYQREFGPGHLVDRENALEGIQTEFSLAAEEGYAPAYTSEAIGGGLCRFHLDPRRVEEADLPLLAHCFASSAHPRGSGEGLWHKLGLLSGMAWGGELPLSCTDVEDFLVGYDLDGCPPISHSDAYRAAYTPHYRVVERDLALFAPVLRAIDRALSAGDDPVIAAIDGRCASGKSTLARRLGQLFDCNVFHMDDYFLPPTLRTPERLSAPGGNVHYERAAEEIFLPLSRGEAVTVTPFDCSTGGMKAPVTLPFKRLSIVEGSYSLHPALAGYSTLHIFLTCGDDIQRKRLEERSPERLEAFLTRWIPMEEAYFDGLSIREQCDVVVDTSPLPTV